MKKYSRFVVLLIVAVLLAGCAKQTVDMTITDNGKMKVEIVSAMVSSMAEYSDEDKAELKKLGFKVEDYKDEAKDLVGIKYSKTYKLSEISGDKAVLVELGSIGTPDFDEKQYFQETGKGKYKATFVFDTSLDGSEEDMSEYADSFEISYSVTLPRKAISNNADSVNGNVYTWTVKYGEKKEINYEFEVKSNTLIYGIGAVVAIVIIGAVVVVLQKKKSKEQSLPTPGIPQQQ
jgi:hypothetical protein